MFHASTQPERELLTDTVHKPRNTYMYDQTTSVELSHIPHVVQKSVEFSGVGSLRAHTTNSRSHRFLCKSTSF